MAEFKSKIKTIEWVDNYSKMVDQTILPEHFEYVNIKTGQEMFDAIKTMIVRGAPAIASDCRKFNVGCKKTKRSY